MSLAGARRRWLLRIALLAIAVPPLRALGGNEDEYAARRRRLAADIAARPPESGSRFDARVMEAIARVPRHLFVPEAQRPFAYADRPLPIGHGQTISQPYVVALMTDLLRPRADDRVLEIGTGSGYQAAIVAELVRSVYTIEIVEPLGVQARERLARLGYRNIEVRIGDGYKGWPEQAPFDAIIVTAGAPYVPPPLVQQLRPGGRMVIPVGPASQIQYLTVIEKKADGSIESREVAPVAFVPLTRERR